MNGSDKRFFQEWSNTEEYHTRIKNAQRIISQEKNHTPYIAFSGGKDSTVMLHMVREILGNIPAYNYDYGEYLPREYRAELFEMCPDLITLPRYKHFIKDFFGVHAKNLAKKYDVVFVGLRKGESLKRRRRINNKEYLTKMRESWPMADLTSNDIWAYIISNNLQYHSHYDRHKSEDIRDVRFSTYFSPVGMRDNPNGAEYFYDWRHRYNAMGQDR